VAKRRKGGEKKAIWHTHFIALGHKREKGKAAALNVRRGEPRALFSHREKERKRFSAPTNVNKKKKKETHFLFLPGGGSGALIGGGRGQRKNRR